MLAIGCLLCAFLNACTVGVVRHTPLINASIKNRNSGPALIQKQFRPNRDSGRNPHWARLISSTGATFQAVGLSNGVLVADEEHIAYYDDFGDLHWSRTDASAPVALDGMFNLYAATSHGVARIRTSDGSVLGKYRVCEGGQLSWLTAKPENTFIVSCNRGDGNAVVKALSYSGSLKWQTVFRGGAFEGAFLRAIDASHTWVVGVRSGARTASAIAVIDSAKRTVLGPVLDARPSSISSAGSYYSLNAIIATGSPIVLAKFDTGTDTFIELQHYNPEPSGNSVSGFAYRVGEATYVSLGDNVYVYKRASTRTAEPLHSHLIGRPLFAKDFLVYFDSRGVFIDNLTNGIERRVDDYPPRFIEQTRDGQIVSWLAESGTVFFDPEKDLLIRLDARCLPFAAAATRRTEYVVCHAPGNDDVKLVRIQ